MNDATERKARVVRGSSWFIRLRFARVTHIGCPSPALGRDDWGVRLVRRAA